MKYFGCFILNGSVHRASLDLFKGFFGVMVCIVHNEGLFQCFLEKRAFLMTIDEIWARYWENSNSSSSFSLHREHLKLDRKGLVKFRIYFLYEKICSN